MDPRLDDLKAPRGISMGGGEGQIMLNRRQIYLGIFNTEVEAHEAYVRASAKYHGDYGRVSQY